jgi:hypothetical protein
MAEYFVFSIDFNLSIPIYKNEYNFEMTFSLFQFYSSKFAIFQINQT